MARTSAPADRVGSAAGVASTRPAAVRIVLHPARWPWWAQVLAVYAATRAWSGVVLAVAAARQPDSYWAPGPPDYWTFVGEFWDGSWYEQIAESGYPGTLPRDSSRAVIQNPWAFFPLFPLLVRPVMRLTGGSWDVVAPITALVLGAAAVLVIDRLVHRQAAARGSDRPRYLALGTVLLVALFPAAPVLQAAYTESLSLLLIALTLWFLVRRAYGWAVPAVVALGFTRAVALPMALVVLVHLGSRLRAHRAGRDALPRGEAAGIVALALAAVLAGLAWPVLCGVVTGVPDAYVQTQAAWRGTFSTAPFVPWLEMAQYLLGGGAGTAVLIAVVVATFALGLSRPARAAGPEVQAWGLAYPAWLLAAILPQSSTIRFLLLAFPLGMATVGLVRSRWWLATVAVAFAAGQIVWVVWLWQITTPTAWPP